MWDKFRVKSLYETRIFLFMRFALKRFFFLVVLLNNGRGRDVRKQHFVFSYNIMLIKKLHEIENYGVHWYASFTNLHEDLKKFIPWVTAFMKMMQMLSFHFHIKSVESRNCS